MIAGIKIYQTLHPLVANNCRYTDRNRYADRNHYALKPSDARIYPDVATEHDDSTPPYITYTDVSALPENTLDGFTGHEWVRMQIDVWHDDKYEGILLANKVIDAINNNIKPSIYGGKTGMRDPDTGLYRQLIEYEFWQTTPTE